MPEIKIKNLTVTYKNRRKPGVTPISSLDDTFENGKFHVLLGFSGSGKTTLLRAIAGTLPYEGSIIEDENEVNEEETSERNLSFVSQDFVLYPFMTIFDNIAYPLRNRGAAREEIIKRVNQTASDFSIAECLSRKPRELSIGQQQRVCLARAMVKHPSLILFDEPLSNIDKEKKKDFLDLIKQTFRKNSITAIYVTHELEEAMALADSIHVLESGKISQKGTPKEIFSSNNDVVLSMKEDYLSAGTILRN